MNWIKLNSEKQLDEIVEKSSEKPVMIFKHSTSCSISAMALDRLERSWNEQEVEMDCYYLDLIANREVLNAVADKFAVAHESPQVLIIKEGISVFDTSHMGIRYQSIKGAVAS